LTTYYIYMSLVQLIFIPFFVIAIRNLYKEWTNIYVDLFRLFQIIFLIGFLLTSNLFVLLSQLNGFRNYFMLNISIGLFFFYYFELINNAWWINLMIHLREKDLNKKSMKRVLSIENYNFIFLIILFVPMISAIICLLILNLVFECHLKVKIPGEGDENWKQVFKGSRIVLNVMYSISVFAILKKIGLGIALLLMMKKKLYTPYKKVRVKVIWTIVLSTAILFYNTLANFVISDNFAIFWGYVFEVSPPDNKKIISEAVLQYLNTIGETSLIWFTSENIDFKNFLIILMRGKRAYRLMPKTSAFIHYRPQNIPIEISQDSTLLNEEDVKSALSETIDELHSE
jgi:hypothetical protein